MPHDDQRTQWNKQALAAEQLDALIVSRPTDVLLISGYWPVVGTSVAVMTADGAVAVVFPEDEQHWAQQGNASHLLSFKPASLDAIFPVHEAVRPTLRQALAKLNLRSGRIGIIRAEADEPASYVATHRFGAVLNDLLGDLLPQAQLVAAEEMLAKLKAKLTPDEIGHLRTACSVAAEAFGSAGAHVADGAQESVAAARMAAGLMSADVGRCGGHLAVMSGPRSASAFGAYALSSPRQMQRGELVLVHCNSQVNGLWTDITRTFCLGRPTDLQQKMYTAVAQARAAALAAIRPGVKAASVDAAARQVMDSHGFGKAFKHATGHGVGLAAIDHNARPRLHPASPDVLEEGMVFNVEPAAYLDEGPEPQRQGMRHCDVVTVTRSGAQVLSDFQQPPPQMAH